ncbi:MAG: glycosyltransferase family 2 protein [Cyanobacteria bacterium P01_D01_bin.1]
MTISVITPSFQQGRFIERTIWSVLNQKKNSIDYDIEYFVIDGGSTDETLAILEKYERSLTWISEPDDGQSHAVNKGLAMSTGEIIAWINSDDIYYSHAFAQVVSFFERNPEARAVYGQADWISETDSAISAYPTRAWNYEELKKECYLCQPAVFFRRSMVERFGDLETRLHYCMDYELWLRYGRMVQFSYLPTKLAGSRIYATNKTFGCRVAAHREANHMLKAQLGYSTRHWIFEYSRLQLISDSSLEETDVVFVAKLLILSVRNCWKFNRNALIVVILKVIINRMQAKRLKKNLQSNHTVENLAMESILLEEDVH